MSALAAAFSILRWRSDTSALALLAFAALVLCTVAGCSDPQKQISLETPTLATVKGRVFLITRGGDLKPARLADVYLLRLDAVLDHASIKRLVVDAVTECKDADNDSGQMGMSQLRRAELSTYEGDIKEVQNNFSRAAVAKWNKGAFSGNADEDGSFTFERVPPGTYIIAAFGHAGVNLGFWQDTITVTTSAQSEIKLPSPVTACGML